MPPRDTKDWMWADACERLDRIERLQRQFFQVNQSRQARPTWEPPADIIETSEEVAVVIALPGVDPGRTEVRIEGDTLIVAAVRPMPTSYRSAEIHRLEIPHGRFERRLQLAWPRLKLTRSDQSDGCLLLVFSKVT